MTMMLSPIQFPGHWVIQLSSFGTAIIRTWIATRKSIPYDPAKDYQKNEEDRGFDSDQRNDLIWFEISGGQHINAERKQVDTRVVS
jgi:hypothetical protein